MDTTIDRIAKRTETQIAFWIANRDQLYKPFLKLCMLNYVVNAVWMIATEARHFDFESYWFIAGLAISLALLFLAFATLSRIKAKKETAMTLLAAFLILNLFTFHVFLFMLGLYVGLNEAFRRGAREWSPQWYVDLTAQFD